MARSLFRIDGISSGSIMARPLLGIARICSGSIMARSQLRMNLKGISFLSTACSSKIASGFLHHRRMQSLTSVPSNTGTHEDSSPTNNLEDSDFSLVDTIRKDVEDNPVVIYMEGTYDQPKCEYNKEEVWYAMWVLEKYNVPIKIIDISEDPELRNAVERFSKYPHFPQIFVMGHSIGNADMLDSMDYIGDLKLVLESASPNLLMSMQNKQPNDHLENETNLRATLWRNNLKDKPIFLSADYCRDLYTRRLQPFLVSTDALIDLDPYTLNRKRLLEERIECISRGLDFVDTITWIDFARCFVVNSKPVQKFIFDRVHTGSLLVDENIDGSVLSYPITFIPDNPPKQPYKKGNYGSSVVVLNGKKGPSIATCACVLRDEQGQVMNARVRQFKLDILDPLLGELLALHLLLEMALEMDVTHLIYEGDSVSLVETLRFESHFHNRLDDWYCVIFERLSKFVDTIPLYTLRAGNGLADFLCHFGDCSEEEVLNFAHAYVRLCPGYKGSLCIEYQK